MSHATPAQLGHWFDAYAARLILYARQWAGSAAEDVVQEAFLKLAGTAPPRDIAAWLFRAVRNAAISEQRSDRRRGRREKEVAETTPGWFSPRPQDLIDARTAQQVLETLPADQREIVILRIWGGLTLAEAAAVTGEAVSTLFSRYQAALAMIRTKMEATCQPKTI